MNDERGYSLLEVLVVCAIMLIIGTLTISSLATHSGSRLITTARFRQTLQVAQALAATSGDGATLEVDPLAGGSRIRLFEHRPDGHATLTPDPAFAPLTLDQSLTLILDGVREPAFSIYLASSGALSVQSADATTPLTAEPSCSNGSVSLSLGLLDCVTGALR